MATWLDELLDSTKELEGSQQFFYWSALAAISAVVKRNVYLNKYAYNLYPNIYVMLIAKSGLRKSLPIDIATKLVRGVNNTRVISGRNSVQGILSESGKAYSVEGGKPVTDAHCFLVSGEFGTLLTDDPKSFTILTDLYDTHRHTPDWKNTLKSSGETLKNPCFTILGASNEELLRDTLPISTIKGGFLGRMLVIEGKDKGKPNALLRKPDKVFSLDKALPYLKMVGETKGEFTFESEDLIKECEDWYNNYFHKEYKDETGFMNRLQDHILKIAMLLSLSRSLELIIRKEDIERAMDTCEKLAVNANKVTASTTKTEWNHAIMLVMDKLLKTDGYQIKRRQILRDFYGDFDAMMLTRIEDHLLQAKMIEVDHLFGEKVYRLTENVISQYESSIGRKTAQKP